eukprot:TRINITY_DN14015_c0_g2_i2.p1 TRINITY_DN14015_c0_g2~~TRINITY_DN14015_c0_g2_i2.p1  ORF type:complete len:1566 (+),score=305.79 TRINITY_DN14015_c0_g2_i2:72-4769(+)
MSTSLSVTPVTRARSSVYSASARSQPPSEINARALFRRIRDSTGDAQRQLVLLRAMGRAVDDAAERMPNSGPLLRIRGALIPGGGAPPPTKMTPLISPLSGATGGLPNRMISTQLCGKQLFCLGPAPSAILGGDSDSLPDSSDEDADVETMLGSSVLTGFILAATGTGDTEAKELVCSILGRLLTLGGPLPGRSATVLTDAGAAGLVTDSLAFASARYWAECCRVLVRSALDIAVSLCSWCPLFAEAYLRSGGLSPISTLLATQPEGISLHTVVNVITGAARQAARLAAATAGQPPPLLTAFSEAGGTVALLRASAALATKDSRDSREGRESKESTGEGARLRSECAFLAAELMPVLPPGAFAAQVEGSDVMQVVKLLGLPEDGGDTDLDHVRVRSAIQVFASLASWHDAPFTKAAGKSRLSTGAGASVRHSFRRPSMSARPTQQPASFRRAGPPGVVQARMVLGNSEAFRLAVQAAPLWWVGNHVRTAEQLVVMIAAMVPHMGHADVLMAPANFSNVCRLLRNTWQDRTPTMIRAAAAMLERAMSYPHHREAAFQQGMHNLMLSAGMKGHGGDHWAVDAPGTTEPAACSVLRVLRLLACANPAKAALLESPMLAHLLPALSRRMWGDSQATTLEALRLLDTLLPEGGEQRRFADGVVQNSFIQATISVLQVVLSSRASARPAFSPLDLDGSSTSPATTQRSFRRVSNAFVAFGLPGSPTHSRSPTGPGDPSGGEPESVRSRRKQSLSVSANVAVSDTLVCCLNVLQKAAALPGGVAAVFQSIGLWMVMDLLRLPGCPEVRQCAARLLTALAAGGEGYRAQLQEAGVPWGEAADAIAASVTESETDPSLALGRRQSAQKIQGVFRGFRKKVEQRQQRTLLQYVLWLQSTWRTKRAERRVRVAKLGIARTQKDEEQRRPRLWDLESREFMAIEEVFFEVTEHIDRKLRHRVIINSEEVHERNALREDEEIAREDYALGAVELHHLVYRMLWVEAEVRDLGFIAGMRRTADMDRCSRLDLGAAEESERCEFRLLFDRGAAQIEEAYAQRWDLEKQQVNGRTRTLKEWEWFALCRHKQRERLDLQCPEWIYRARVHDAWAKAQLGVIGKGFASRKTAWVHTEARDRLACEDREGLDRQRLRRASQQQYLMRVEDDRRNELLEEVHLASGKDCVSFYSLMFEVEDRREARGRRCIVRDCQRCYRGDINSSMLTLTVALEDCWRRRHAREGLAGCMAMRSECSGDALPKLSRVALAHRDRISREEDRLHRRHARLHAMIGLVARENIGRRACAGAWKRIGFALAESCYRRTVAVGLALCRSGELRHRAELAFTESDQRGITGLWALTEGEHLHRHEIQTRALHICARVRHWAGRINAVAGQINRDPQENLMDACAAARALKCSARWGERRRPSATARLRHAVTAARRSGRAAKGKRLCGSSGAAAAVYSADADALLRLTSGLLLQYRPRTPRSTTAPNSPALSVRWQDTLREPTTPGSARSAAFPGTRPRCPASPSASRGGYPMSPSASRGWCPISPTASRTVPSPRTGGRTPRWVQSPPLRRDDSTLME